MQFGKSIRIFLKDGTVTGIKFGEVVNQTIQSISCPRLSIAELNKYPESKRPGVYFLFGQDEDTNEPKAYIGEAENVYERLQSHISNKDFWNEVVFFVSKDDNLTKSHVKYLESRLIQTALLIRRYKVENFNQPQLASLPMADRDAMEEFLTYIKLLIGVLGHKILEEIIKADKKIVETITISDPIQNPENESLSKPLELYLSMSGLKAKSVQTNEGIVVLKGSEAAKEHMNSLGFAYREIRERLVQNLQLKLIGDKLVFQDDILFDSPSAAAASILGYATNGRINWKDQNGKTLKEIEESKMNSLGGTNL